MIHPCNHHPSSPSNNTAGRLSADLETPISLFLSLTRDQTPGLLLESAEVDGKWGRYSVIACDYLMTVSCADARLSLTVSDERLASLKELDGMPYLDGLRVLMQRLELVGDDKRQAPITRALYGYFGYETAALFQPQAGADHSPLFRGVLPGAGRHRDRV